VHIILEIFFLVVITVVVTLLSLDTIYAVLDICLEILKFWILVYLLNLFLYYHFDYSLYLSTIENIVSDSSFS